jgi:adenosylcobinamide kinase/adenosylcobinamide-phosphate guanylyltransferase
MCLAILWDNGACTWREAASLMIVVTGGSASGKSSYAESLCCALPQPRYYVATMQPFGEEGAQRIARHRALRAGKDFETVERYSDLAGVELPQRGTVLLEDVGNLVANEMFDGAGNHEDPTASVVEGVSALEMQCEALVVVTNEVGSDGKAYDEDTQAYMRVLGHINAELVEAADVAVEVVCGIPLVLKGMLPPAMVAVRGAAS